MPTRTPAEIESAALKGFPSIPFPVTAERLMAMPQIAIKSIPAVSVLTTAASPYTLFTVTGLVLANVFAISGAALASTSSTGTLAVGVSGNTGAYLPAATINGTNFPAANTVWAGDNSPTLLGEVISAGALTGVLQGPTPIIATIATNNLTTGSITFYCYYYAISPDGQVIPS